MKTTFEIAAVTIAIGTMIYLVVAHRNPDVCREHAEVIGWDTDVTCDSRQTIEVETVAETRLLVCRCPKDAPPEAGR